jgi:hypothetical protein
VRAYKFLQPGEEGEGFVGPFSGFAWPLPAAGGPGAVVRSRSPEATGGVSACRVRDLPYWIHDTLWVIELSGAVVELDVKVVAEAGRLAARVHAWDGATAARFATDCAERLRTDVVEGLERQGHRGVAASVKGATLEALKEDAPRRAAEVAGRGGRDLAMLVGYLGDAAECAVGGDAAVGGYVAAHAARYVALLRPPPSPDEDPFAAERAQQAGWFARLLEA